VTRIKAARRGAGTSTPTTAVIMDPAARKRHGRAAAIVAGGTLAVFSPAPPVPLQCSGMDSRVALGSASLARG